MELHEDDDKLTPHVLIGRHLRRVREMAGITQRALAEQIGYPYSYIARVERHEQLPSEALAEALDVHLRTGGLFCDLLSMSMNSLVAPYSQEFETTEAEALRIEVFTSSLIPGLLQTEDYAREVLAAGLPHDLLGEMETRVASRMDRQKVLSRDDPPLFWSIMDESALKRPTTNRRVMIEQLDRVIGSVSERVRVQILPFGQAFHPLMSGSLTLLTKANGVTRSLVESFGTGVAIDVPRQVMDLQDRFDVARSQALPPLESVELIRTYLREYKG
ncbi:helix-turn-helix domain-containing protein [Streptomyces zagrosensis]|uniref:Transcriptional regulator with XRE-family HTH domain n=1 Tax=Streptomyces zagrosensis TaxID=1042984 RepID=A0A7W9QGL8_9ACTN|nr:helix-turn-helix transcriptional regulator [Streptomyces zagrosensis]MBB5939890.1 transcriptional regulator with XRE-family HTH domain [Streptomyces zagrosensis]